MKFLLKFITSLFRIRGSSAPSLPKPGTYEYFPVSTLVHDQTADRELHKFLLGETKETKITVGKGKETTEYEVGFINIDLAPPIPAKDGNTTHNPE